MYKYPKQRMLYSKNSSVQTLVNRMKEKFKEYPFVYLFGKDRKIGLERELMSLREKRKMKGSMTG